MAYDKDGKYIFDNSYWDANTNNNFGANTGTATGTTPATNGLSLDSYDDWTDLQDGQLFGDAYRYGVNELTDPTKSTWEQNSLIGDAAMYGSMNTDDISGYDYGGPSIKDRAYNPTRSGSVFGEDADSGSSFWSDMFSDDPDSGMLDTGKMTYAEAGGLAKDTAQFGMNLYDYTKYGIPMAEERLAAAKDERKFNREKMDEYRTNRKRSQEAGLAWKDYDKKA